MSQIQDAQGINEIGMVAQALQPRKMLKRKEIKCKVCQTPCFSGKGGLCNEHAREKAKAKAVAKKKSVAAANRKAGNVTEEKLWKVMASLIKDIYPVHCHACAKPLTKGTIDCQACHIASRGKKVFKWDIRNVYPGCSTCNGFDEMHVIKLAQQADRYWGPGTSEMIYQRRMEEKKWAQNQLNRLYALYKNPPQGKTDQETRELILQQYLSIFDV